MKSSADQLIQITSSLADQGYAQAMLGMVSPCSTCKNFLAKNQDGVSACPRRAWQSFADMLTANGSDSSLPPDYLLRNGRDPESSAFENPVAWPEAGTRLVWVALLQDNQSVSNAAVRGPDLLSGDFDTTTIQCYSFPFIPACREGEYYAGSQLREKDFVMAHKLWMPQLDQSNPLELIQIAGVCQKITPMQKAVVTPAKASVNPRGI